MRVFRDSKQKKLITTDNQTIVYETDMRESRHPVLVFLHGLGGDLTNWDKERLYFNDLEFSTIAIDLRGHGLSSRPDTKELLELSLFAKDIKEVLEREQVKKYILVGHCFGGMVALTYYSITCPEALVLVDTNFKPTIFSLHHPSHILVNFLLHIMQKVSPHMHIAGYKYFTTSKSMSEWNPIDITKGIARLSLRNYLCLFDTVINIDLKKILKEIAVPTLILTGDKDTVFPPEIAESLHKKIKYSTLEYVADGNHLIVMNNPLEVSVSIHHFLKQNHLL